ncbi:MAG TPA: hypothetical protein DEW46_09595, partial [Verrucomicrobia bacterium]|nr:hypothetical protein [Verrucomicrobiota bacterium]
REGQRSEVSPGSASRELLGSNPLQPFAAVSTQTHRVTPFMAPQSGLVDNPEEFERFEGIDSIE